MLELVEDTRFRVAIVGRPNVGKSTIFNKLCGGKSYAIADSTPHTTRDYQESVATLFGSDFTVIDTAGVDNIDKLLQQTEDVLLTADMALVVTDAKEPLTAVDIRLGNYALKKGIPCIHVLNKCESLFNNNDDNQDVATTLEKNTMHLGLPVQVSAEFGYGLEDLYSLIRPLELRHKCINELRQLRLEQNRDAANADSQNTTLSRAEDEVDQNLIRLALIGQTNVGKSTMLNKLIGRERVIVSSEPGTTRDTIEMRCIYKDRRMLVADTAGLRKKKWLTDRIAELSHEDAMRTIRFANVVVLLVDANQPLTREDLRIADMISQEGRAIVIAANKWDQITSPYETASHMEQRVITSLAQLRGIAVVVCSGLTGKNLDLLMTKCVDAFERWNRRIPTGPLNRFLEKFLQTIHLPSSFPSIKYITQTGIRPPTFAVFFTKQAELPQQLERQIVNAIREEFSLEGVPIRLVQRKMTRTKR